LNIKFKFLFILFLILGILSGGTGTFAASPKEGRWNKWELGVGIGFNMPSLSTTYNHTYSPIFSFSSPDDLFSTASEILNFKHKKSMGLNLMLSRMITKKVGIQLLAEFHKTTLQGKNNSFYYYLEYTAYPYPYFNPTLVTREAYIDWNWLDNGGYLKQSSLSLNLITRFYLGDTITFDFSGGPCFFGLSGEASSLKYLKWVFAHYILVPDFIVLKFSYKSAVRLGLNIGGEIDLPILHGLIFFLNCRYFYSPVVSSEIHFKEVILNPQSYNLWDRLEEINTVMNPGPLKINPSFLILNTGFKLRF
jgi:hypothetical protein